MTETPHGSRDAVQTDSPSSPQVSGLRTPGRSGGVRMLRALRRRPARCPRRGTLLRPSSARPGTGADCRARPERTRTGSVRRPTGAATVRRTCAPGPTACAAGRASAGRPARRRGRQFGAAQAGPQAGPPRYDAHPGYGYGTPAGGTTPPTSGGTWPYAAPEPKKPRPGGRLVAVGRADRGARRSRRRRSRRGARPQRPDGCRRHHGAGFQRAGSGQPVRYGRGCRRDRDEERGHPVRARAAGGRHRLRRGDPFRRLHPHQRARHRRGHRRRLDHRRVLRRPDRPRPSSSARTRRPTSPWSR
jgi:hypothetical protein